MEKKKTKKQTKRIPENKSEMEETKRYKIKKQKKHKKLWKTIKMTLLIIFLITIIVVGIFIGKIYGIFKEVKLNMDDIVIKYENSVVKDIDGNTIAVLSGDENREYISISEMSPYLPKAFVAIEDERFYEHNGVDIKRTTAATVKYGLSKLGLGTSSYGGSTITQQFLKVLTEENERTWQRKVKEIAKAYYLEKELSKTEILELYLNLIFLGDQTYGVQIASNYYFSKDASELTVAESAFLAGINDGPNYYDPFSTDEEDIAKIKRKTKIVLDKMYELGKENPEHKAAITEEEYNAGIEQLENGLAFNKGTIAQNIYSYHTDAAINQVKDELKEKYGWTEEYASYYVKSGGLTIYTTQNTSMQSIMEEEVKKDKYKVYSTKQKDSNGNAVLAQTAMVLIDHKTGYVLATVGGIGEKTTSFGLNRATQSTRQTGSSMKPLAVLCPGIDSGIITAGTVLDDIPYSSGTLKGFKNYGYVYKGLTTVRYAIAASQNIPMLKAIGQIGVSRSVEFLKSAGITTIDDENDVGISVALGGLTNGVSPLEMAGAYAAIANDGVYIEPTFYTKVVDSNGEIVLESEQEKRTIMSSATAYIVKEILTEVVRSGAGGYAAISGISVGVKTGTTNDDYDRWFCGFTPYYTAATWFGYDKNEYVNYSGYNPAGKIWDGVMEQVHVGLASAKFSDTKPNNVVTASICKCSGKLATENCKNDPRGSQVYTEYYIKGTAPTEPCDTHVQATICLTTGRLANEYCTEKETKVYITRPSTETGDWSKAADASYMLTVTEICTEHKTTETKQATNNETEETQKTTDNSTNEVTENEANNTSNSTTNSAANNTTNSTANNAINNSTANTTTNTQNNSVNTITD